MTETVWIGWISIFFRQCPIYQRDVTGGERSSEGDERRSGRLSLCSALSGRVVQSLADLSAISVVHLLASLIDCLLYT